MLIHNLRLRRSVSFNLGNFQIFINPVTKLKNRFINNECYINIENKRKWKKVTSLLEDYLGGDLSNLSIVQIITMQILLKYPHPLVRYSLYAHINQFLKKKDHPNIEGYGNLPKAEQNFYSFLQKKKELSTSSFYNNLSNLEKKRLVEFNLNKKGKIDSVKTTPLTASLINNVLLLFLQQMPNYTDFYKKTFQKLVEKTGPLFQRSKLLINLEKDLSPEFMRGFIDNCEEAFVISSNKSYDDFDKSGVKDFNITKIHNGKIREPDNVFDRVLIRRYRKISDFHGLTRIELVKEAFRVTKPGGTLIIYAIEKLPKTNNYYADELLRIIKPVFEDFSYEKHEFKQELEDASISNIEVVEIKGILCGIGRKWYYYVW